MLSQHLNVCCSVLLGVLVLLPKYVHCLCLATFRTSGSGTNMEAGDKLILEHSTSGYQRYKDQILIRHLGVERNSGQKSEVVIQWL